MDAVHVVGAGGIGCAVGYALRAAGVPVVFVDANPRKVEAGRRDGVTVEGRPSFSAEFVPFAEWEPPAEATVLLCTKCYDNAEVLSKLPLGIALIPIQNGFDSRLHEYGHHDEGIASFVSECDRDRPHTRITRPGELHFGWRANQRPSQPESRTEPTLRVLAETDLFAVHAVGDIEPFKYAKLMYNAAISPIAAAAGIDNGQLLSIPTARGLFFALIEENHRILSTAGVPLGKVGPFRPATVAWILRRKWLAGLMAKGFEPSLRGTYCSMAGDIERGRTEIDNYNGHLIRLADAHGIPHPLNRAVYDLVTRMTRERIAPHVGVLEGLSADQPVMSETKA